LHGGIDSIGQPETQGHSRTIDRVVERLVLVLRKRLEYVVGQIPLPLEVPLPAYADAEARDLGGPERREDRRDSSMPSRRASRAHSQGSERKIYFVIDDTEVRRIDTVLLTKS